MASDSDDMRRIMIAVAIIALKHKPSHTSIAAYAIQLKGLFPLPVTISSDDGSASIWRQRAAELEDELMTLRDKYNTDCADLSILRAKITTVSFSVPGLASPSSSNATTAPKKKKKRSSRDADGDDSSLGTVTFSVSARWNGSEDIRAPAVVDSLRVLSSLQQFQTADSGKAKKAAPVPVERLLFLAKTVIDGLGRRLPSVLLLEQTIPNNYQDIVQDIDRILLVTLDSALASLPTATIKRSVPLPAKMSILSSLIDQLIGSLTAQVILPIIKRIQPLSMQILQSRLHQHNTTTRKPKNSEPVPDIRKDLLNILYRCLGILHDHDRAILRKSNDLRKFVAAAAAKEISSLWAYTDSPNQTKPIRGRKLSREERIATLSRKETLALLCSLLHDMLPAVANSTHSSKHSHFAKADAVISEVTMHEISGVLSSLLTRCSDQSGMMSEIEKGLLMAVVEKGWLEGAIQMSDSDCT